MDLKGINLVQYVSNTKINKKENLKLKNKIENKSMFKIFDITLLNYTSVDFSQKYYEFEKNRDEIEISNVKGEIKINELLPGDEVIVHTSVFLDNEIFTNHIESYCNLEFSTKEYVNAKIKSNENIIIVEDQERENVKLKIESDKNSIDEDDFYKLKIIVRNEEDIVIKDVELINIIPLGTEILKDSLYINNSFINAGNKLNSIKLGNVLPNQKIEIELGLKLNTKYINSSLVNKVKMKYKIATKEKEKEIILESNLIKVDLRKAQVVNFKKYANKREVKLGEEVIFTITCKNQGNVKLYDLEFLDDIGNGFRYVNNSLIINGRKSEVEKHNVLMIDCLNIGEEIKYSYKCIAQSCETQNNNVFLKYKYIGLNGIKSFEKTSICECSKIEIKYANLSNINKCVDKENIFVGEDATCEIVVKNTGNVDAKNVVITDCLSKEISLIEDTIFINGVACTKNNLSKIKIDTISSQEEVKIRYKIVGTDISTYKDVEQTTCEIKYSYLIEEKEIQENKKFENKKITVNGAVIKKENLNKSLDKVSVGLDDEILVKIKFENSGNYDAEKIFIKENYNTSICFIKGSLKINGKKSDYDVEEGFLLGDAKPREEFEIAYKLKVIKIPYNDITLSTTNIIYESISSESGIRSSNMLVSQSENIVIKSANINYENGLFIREVNKKDIEEGGIIRFKILFRNNGNISAKNVVLKEIVPNNLKIIDNVVYVNGMCKKIENNIINIGEVAKEEQYEIIYKAIIEKSDKRTIETKSIVEYSYYSSIETKLIKKESKSNCVEIKSYSTDILFVNNSIQNEIDIDEVFQYNLYMTNKGDVNFYDGKLLLKISDGIQLEILSYKVNNIEQKIKNLQEKVDIKKFSINDSLIITIDLIVKSVNNKNNLVIEPIFESVFYNGYKECNISKKGDKAYTDIDLCSLKILKKTARDIYTTDETIDYIISITNDGAKDAENILINDESLTQGNLNGRIYVNKKVLNNLYIKGIPIEKLEVGQSVNIRYSMKYNQVKNQKYIKSNVKATAEFIKNDNTLKEYEFISNEHILKLQEAKLEIIRSVNKEIIDADEYVRFFSIIKNIGQIDIHDLNLNETNLNGFKRKDIYINSLLVELSEIEDNQGRLKLPNMKSGDELEVVTEYIYNYTPKNLEVRTSGVLEYAYKGINKKTFIRKKESDEIIIKISSNMFKNFNIKQKINMSSFENLSLAEITDITVDISITDQYVIKTIKNKENKENIATGKKLMIRGELISNIEYITGDLIESLNMFIYKENFTTSIVVPEDTDELKKFSIHAKVIDVSYKLLDKKVIVDNINIFIEVF